MKEKTYFSMKKNTSAKAEIFIYGEISSESYRGESDTSAVSFKHELDALGDVKQIDLHINSGGGNVFEAYAIYNMLLRHKATIEVYVDGLAASAASLIAMAGKTIHMPENSYLMIHNAWVVAAGDYRELEKSAKVLKNITDNFRTAYLTRNLTIAESKVTEMMNDETWIAAKSAIALGFADNLLAPSSAAASVDTSILNNYRNVPGDLIKMAKASKEDSAKQAAAAKKQASGQQKANAQQRLLNFAKVLGNAAEDMANKEAERKADKESDYKAFKHHQSTASRRAEREKEENRAGYFVGGKFIGGRRK